MISRNHLITRTHRKWEPGTVLKLFLFPISSSTDIREMDIGMGAFDSMYSSHQVQSRSVTLVLWNNMFYYSFEWIHKELRLYFCTSKIHKAPKERTLLRCYKKSLSNKLICFDIFLINVSMFCSSAMRN